MGRRQAVISAAAASIIALLLGFFSLRRGPTIAASRPTVSAQPIDSVAASSPAEAARSKPSSPAPPPTTPPTAASAPPLDEPALMQQLRELRSSDPPLSLALARQGQARFKDSPDAAERAWFVVKALTELGRHDEARAEAHSLIDEYHDTRWAQDVYRHLLVNPGTHPFERGYGKQLESDP